MTSGSDRFPENKPCRICRWVFLGVVGITIPAVIGMILILTIGQYLFFEGSDYLLLIAALPIGGEIMRLIIHRFWVVIPQVQLLVTVNPYRNIFGGDTDPNVTYTAGQDGPSYPWEARSSKSNITGEVVTVEWDDRVPGAETEFILRGSYQFRVDRKLADRFVGIDEATIRSGAIDLIRAEVGHLLADKDGDEGKRQIKTFNDKLYDEFGVGESDPTREVSDFEKNYGIETVKVTISSIDFPDEVQKTRNARDEARQVMLGVANLYGIRVDVLRRKMESGEITTEEYNEMLDRFFAASDNANMNIQAFKINNPSAFAAAFAAAFGRK